MAVTPAEREQRLAEIRRRWTNGPVSRDSVADDAEFIMDEVDRLQAERDSAQEQVRALRAALDAVWDYEESVQRNLRARGEVSDGTMHKLLRAKDLRAAALKGET